MEAEVGQDSKRLQAGASLPLECFSGAGI